MTFQPDVVAPANSKGQAIVAILLTVDDAHKLALGDAVVTQLVNTAITARLVNPPAFRHTRAVLTEQSREQRWRRLYLAMTDDLNPDAELGDADGTTLQEMT